MAIRTVTKVGGTVVPTGDADILWNDKVIHNDKIIPKVIIPDQLVLQDVHKETIKIADQLVLGDRRVVPAITALYAQRLRTQDTALGRINELKVARSGTPDADILGDAWTDGVPIRNGDNHGNESPLPCSGNLLSATTTYPWFKWNLTTPKFIGITHRAGTGTCILSFWISQGLAVAQSLNINISVKTTNPFTESTLTFSNQPTLGTNQVTRVVSILVGAVNGRYDITLTPTEFAPFIGNWMLVRMDSAAVLATPINIASREAANVNERPLISFDFKR